MHYFTKELWQKINDPDEKVRVEAEKEWNTRNLEYQKQFKKNKKFLSHKFTKEFISHNGLHDYAILSIEFVKEKRAYTCKMRLSDGTEHLLLGITGVKSCKIDISSFLCCQKGNLTWGYGEFGLNLEKNMCLTVFCDIQNVMYFEFESIQLNKTRDGSEGGDKRPVLLSPLRPLKKKTKKTK